MRPQVLYGYLAFPRLDGSADFDIESMASVMAVSISTIMHWLTNLIEYGFIEPQSMHGTFAPLPDPTLLMPTEAAHARAGLIAHVATFDTVASIDAWIEDKTEEDRLLDTPLPLAEAIHEACYILAARAALHVKEPSVADVSCQKGWNDMPRFQTLQSPDLFQVLTFRKGDSVFLVNGPGQGTVGTFLNFRDADPKWAYIFERKSQVLLYPVEWLEHMPS